MVEEYSHTFSTSLNKQEITGRSVKNCTLIPFLPRPQLYPVGYDIGGQERRIALFIHLTCCQRKDGIRRIFLGCRETIAVQFQKQHTEHKALTLVPINEGMVFYDTKKGEKNAKFIIITFPLYLFLCLF